MGALKPLFAGLVALPLLAVAFAGLASAHHATETLELYPRDVSDPCVQDALQVRVNVHGISHKGLMKLELYAEEDGFLEKKGRLRIVRVEAQDGPQQICINVPKAGEYAVAGYHDKDGDRKLDKKWNFTPKEPYGLSNNPEIKTLRFPKFSEAAFIVPETGIDIDINLVDLRRKGDKKKKDKDKN